MPTVSPQTDVLIVTDIQNDFLPGGALAVPDGDAVLAPVNALARKFHRVILTQDWHPPGHISFASTHPGGAPLDSLTLDDGRTQILWPDHCLQGSHGADIADALDIAKAELVIRKGYDKDLDSYSVFVEADRKTKTGLAGYLRERGFTRVFITGLATDFCAGWTAIDAAESGFETYLVEDACGAIDTDGSLGRAVADMDAVGVRRITTTDLV